MKFVLSAATVAAPALAGMHFRSCQTPEPVLGFDRDAYMGTWFEIYRDVE